MRLRITSFFMLMLGLIGATGCGSARLVTANEYGGIVAIPHNSNVWPTYYRDKAEELIRSRCPAGYEIVEEGEAVTGTVSHTDSRTDTRDTPTLLLGGGNGTTERTRRGERHSDSFGGIAIPLGEVEQTTHQTTTYRDVTEWRIHYVRRSQTLNLPAETSPKPEI